MGSFYQPLSVHAGLGRVSRPRIGIDATSVAPNGKGAARVQRSLVGALAALGRYDVVAYLRTPEAASLFPGESVVLGPGRAVVWEQLGMRRALRRVDLLLTMDERLPLGAERRVVVWLFELPTHRIAENRRVGAGWYQRSSDLVTSLLWRHSLAHAGRVVAGSRATARELGRDVPVVYPGLDEAFGPGPGREGCYVFHIASSDPRDNTATVLDAFARVDTDAELLVGGGLGELEPDLRERAGERVRFLGRVTDDELAALYRGAAAYVDATLYEGFGYQVLEAMACGAPVVASSLTSIPEVVGDAGLLCDPRDPKAIAAALTRVLSNADEAAAMRERGLERAATFTWERTAKAFADVLDEALR
jgi:glycosyltransferase involved in cell wall biosynthesis